MSLPQNLEATIEYLPQRARSAKIRQEGFLQLTNPSNYCSYWEWRGRTAVSARLKKSLVDAYIAIAENAPKERKSSGLQDSNFKELTTEIIGWRTQVGAQTINRTSEDLLAPSDSAGFYWIKNKMGLYADGAHELERVRVTTESGARAYYRSQAFWKASAAVNLPGRISKTNYSGLNGFDSRCCAYGVLLAVLTEMKFPNSKGEMMLSFPEGISPRRNS